MLKQFIVHYCIEQLVCYYNFSVCVIVFMFVMYSGKNVSFEDVNSTFVSDIYYVLFFLSVHFVFFYIFVCNTLLFSFLSTFCKYITVSLLC